jgi:hypothetical protein
MDAHGKSRLAESSPQKPLNMVEGLFCFSQTPLRSGKLGMIPDLRRLYSKRIKKGVTKASLFWRVLGLYGKKCFENETSRRANPEACLSVSTPFSNCSRKLSREIRYNPLIILELGQNKEIG